MTHLPYVMAAYAVFVLVLGSDAIGSWLRLRWARRLAARRQQRQQARAAAGSAPPVAPELTR
ncbi:heme exporter protein CcmD [Stenotrophomonas sp.]|jgi:heme exporter protein D|uniref:heme exporter protein CcmD n=1 Tax=Stenotrophomonas sp. TaxID=69392 RepID=UPI0029AF0906|nr:heme exporter protein CcmD [Stenotrophomonas sp.]MDX3936425.1 heme exporter protein CcmD [Stenotrophomonas sp.]